MKGSLAGSRVRVRIGVRGRGAGGGCVAHVVLVGLLLVSVGWWGGCKGKKAGGGKSGKEAAKPGWAKVGNFEVKLPDEKGHYEYRGKFPERYRCQKDSDCVLTHLVPGSCCPDQCESHAANKTWILALRKLHYPTCRAWQNKHGFEACGRPKCPMPKGVPKARCVKNRCRVAYRPIVGKVKYNTVPQPELKGPPEKPGARAKAGQAPAHVK